MVTHPGFHAWRTALPQWGWLIRGITIFLRSKRTALGKLHSAQYYCRQCMQWLHKRYCTLAPPSMNYVFVNANYCYHGNQESRFSSLERSRVYSFVFGGSCQNQVGYYTSWSQGSESSTPLPESPTQYLPSCTKWELFSPSTVDDERIKLKATAVKI